jgi:hypothetical protein
LRVEEQRAAEDIGRMARLTLLEGVPAFVEQILQPTILIALQLLDPNALKSFSL